MMSDIVEPTEGWLLIKRGLYWMPNAQGYTGLKRRAGRYSLDDARSWTGHQSEITMVHESSVPDFSDNCYPDIKADELAKRESAEITALRERVRALEAAQKTAVSVLVSSAQILDVVKQEWLQSNSWSEWDQSVRDSYTAYLVAAKAMEGK
jgi:hypothetical protein